MVRKWKLKLYKTPLLMILSFLMGLTIAINMMPVNKTCRIEDSDREYNIMRNSKFRNPELIILILSAPRNLDKRNTIRQTWLKLKDNANVKFKMKHYFVVGNFGLTVDEVLHLTTEQSQFSDIVILPMYDNYSNLTEKVVKSFEWLDQQYNFGLNYKYVLKCDDDSFVRIDELGNELAKLQSLQKAVDSPINDHTSPFYRFNAQANSNRIPGSKLEIYWGYFNGNAKVKSVGKWKESNWIGCDRYVPYALGGGYVLSKQLVSFLAKNANDLRYFNSEDVSVGLWLLSVNNILRIHDIRFDTEWTSRGCQNYHLITHNISTKEMRILHEHLVKSNKMCFTENLKRNYYLYDWSLPTSQCCNTKTSKT